MPADPISNKNSHLLDDLEAFKSAKQCRGKSFITTRSSRGSNDSQSMLIGNPGCRIDQEIDLPLHYFVQQRKIEDLLRSWQFFESHVALIEFELEFHRVGGRFAVERPTL